jgi:uncharacterized short protein YbdD (DUF466 family)
MRAVRRGVTAIRWYLREMTGESRYEKYLASVRDQGERPVMTEREFWCERTRHEEATPSARCC